MTIYERALEFVHDGDVVGLGSGHAAAEFIKALGLRVKGGLRVRGVPTSEASAKLAAEAGVPLTTLEAGMPLSVAVDGADEWDPQLNLVKGFGRALLREKVVAAAAAKFVVLVGPGKEVHALGERGDVPVEVVPFALPLCRARLRDLGCDPVLWAADGKPALTDNGNYILDCRLARPLRDPHDFDAKARAVPGVVGTGLFLGMADAVLVGDDHFQLVAEKRRDSLTSDL
jgi:ribose 5-phosphate isomerase A